MNGRIDLVLVAVGVCLAGSLGLGAEWEPMSSGTTSALIDVWGTGPNDVFAVGGGLNEPNRGVILHYDGAGWSEMTFPTERAVFGVWGTGPDDVYAAAGELDVPNAALVLHYDGVTWSVATTAPTNYLYGVWGTGPNNVFAVGTNGTILHYDGAGFSSMASGTSDTLLRIWGSGPNDIFVVGWCLFEVTDLHYDGSSWSELPGPGGGADVWGTAHDEVFSVALLGLIRRYDGSAWSAMASGTMENLFGIWGTGSDNIFVAGWSGTILRYDGTDWIASASGTTADLFGVWGSGPDDVFAVGENGTILHRGKVHALTITYKNAQYGRVTFDPEPGDANHAVYATGTLVTLTAEPNEGKSFKKWEIYDPNHPDDANYTVTDVNDSLTILMDADWKVKAFFDCGGSGMGPIVPLILGVLGVAVLKRART